MEREKKKNKQWLAFKITYLEELTSRGQCVVALRVYTVYELYTMEHTGALTLIHCVLSSDDSNEKSPH